MADWSKMTPRDVLDFVRASETCHRLHGRRVHLSPFLSVLGSFQLARRRARPDCLLLAHTDTGAIRTSDRSYRPR